jgi:hypothetical protein
MGECTKSHDVKLRRIEPAMGMKVKMRNPTMNGLTSK